MKIIETQVRTSVWREFELLSNTIGFDRRVLLNKAIDADLDLLERIIPCDTHGKDWLHKHWPTRFQHITPEEHNYHNLPLKIEDDTFRSLEAICNQKGVPVSAFLNIVILRQTTAIRLSQEILKHGLKSKNHIRKENMTSATGYFSIDSPEQILNPSLFEELTTTKDDVYLYLAQKEFGAHT